MATILSPIELRNKVRSTLGAATDNCGLLCTHPNINRWSKWKPVRLNKVTGLTENDLKSVNFGLTTEEVSPSQLPSTKALENGMFIGGTYLQPRGGSQNEFYTVNGTKSDKGFTGDITGNASSATKLQTARTIWGQSFDGTGNVAGELSNVVNIAMSGAIFSHNVVGFLNSSAAQGINIGSLLVSNNYSHRSNVPTNGIWSLGDIISNSKAKAPIFDFGNGWTMEAAGSEIHVKQSGTVRAKFMNGAFVSTGELTAYA